MLTALATFYHTGGAKDVGAPEGTLFLPFAIANMGLVSDCDLLDMTQRFKDLGWAREEGARYSKLLLP